MDLRVIRWKCTLLGYTPANMAPSVRPLVVLLLLLVPRSDATRLLLVRHGCTFMNEHLSQPGKGWGAAGFVDPGLWDTGLTPNGEAQARELNAQLRARQSAGEPKVDLLLASLLRRALATAELGFAGVFRTSQRVEPLAAERCYLSSDVGSPRAELQRDFSPAWSISADTLAEGWWFQGDGSAEWRPPGTYLHPGECGPAFYARMGRLIAALRACEGEHGVVALVAHWGVLHALTGRSFANCEWADMTVAELPDAPFVEPDV